MTSPSVDSYLEAVENTAFRDCLQDLRVVLRDLLPQAQECISYGMPGFRQKKMVAGFAAFKHHCGFYPHSGSVIPKLTHRLTGFRTSKSGVLFTPENPLPRAIVEEIVALRLAEIG